MAPRAPIADRALDAAQLKALRHKSDALLGAPCLRRIEALPVHGAPLVRMLREIRAATADHVITHLLAFHRGVQRDRRWGDAWIRDRDGELTLLLMNYKAQDGAARFPSFKLDVLRTLLRDLGRIALRDPDGEEEDNE